MFDGAQARGTGFSNAFVPAFFRLVVRRAGREGGRRLGRGAKSAPRPDTGGG